MAGYISKFATGATIEAILEKANNSQSVSAAEKANWNNKQNALTFDTTPTENSTNPVTSGGLYNMQSTLETEIASKATIDSIYGPGISLASGTDLNDITEEGTYYTTSINVTGTLLNAPFTANRIKLLVFRISTDAESSLRCTQILLPQSSTIGFFIRHCVNGTWANWIQYSDVVTSVSGLGVNITENADLNDYTTPGIYQCPTTSIAGTLTNSPVSATNTFRMEVNTLNTSAVLMQTVYPLGGTEFYIRKYRSSGWQPWYKFAGEVVT